MTEKQKKALDLKDKKTQYVVIGVFSVLFLLGFMFFSGEEDQGGTQAYQDAMVTEEQEASAEPATAIKKDTDSLKTDLWPLLDENLPRLPPGEFEASSTEIREIPLDDGYLEYTVRYPSGWEKIPKEQLIYSRKDGTVIGDAARFAGPAFLGERSVLELRTIELTVPLSVETWLLDYSTQEGLNILGAEKIADYGLEVFAAQQKNGESNIVRFVAIISGSRVIIMQYIMPSEFWQTEAPQMGSTINSFRLKKRDTSLPDPLESYAFLDLIEVDYPSSFQVYTPPFSNIERIPARFLNMLNEKQTNGWIDVNVIMYGTSTIQEEIAKMQNRVEKYNLKTMEAPDLIDEGIAVPPNAIFNRFEMYRATEIGKDRYYYEVWYGIIETNEFIYTLVMVTPNRDEDLINWAKNTDAFKTIVKSFRVFEY